jgi:hypothetical protein
MKVQIQLYAVLTRYLQYLSTLHFFGRSYTFFTPKFSSSLPYNSKFFRMKSLNLNCHYEDNETHNTCNLFTNFWWNIWVLQVISNSCAANVFILHVYMSDVTVPLLVLIGSKNKHKCNITVRSGMNCMLRWYCSGRLDVIYSISPSKTGGAWCGICMKPLPCSLLFP